MSEAVEFLTVEEVAVIHEDQLRRYGGASGFRDLGLLESAVQAPVFAAYYSGSLDLFWLTAIYVVRLTQDHPFVDGSRRTGVVAARVFLQLYGIRLSAAAAYQRRLESLVRDIAQRRARWLTDLLDVTLVSPDPYQVCLTELPEVVRGLSAESPGRPPQVHPHPARTRGLTGAQVGIPGGGALP